MVKRWLTPHPGMADQDSHLEFVLKIQHVYGQKMIDPPGMTPGYDRPGSHLEFFKDSTCPWSKDDWPPTQVWQTRISPRIFLKIQHVHGQKMIDPPVWPVWQTRLSPRIFLKIQHMHGQKMMDPPPSVTQICNFFVSAGSHIGHHRGLSHERPIRDPQAGSICCTKVHKFQKVFFGEVVLQNIPCVCDVFVNNYFLAL